MGLLTEVILVTVRHVFGVITGIRCRKELIGILIKMEYSYYQKELIGTLILSNGILVKMKPSYYQNGTLILSKGYSSKWNTH